MRSTLLHNRINMLAWLCIRTKKVLTNLSHAPTLRVWPWQTAHQDYPSILLPPSDNCPNHRNYPWQPFVLSLTRLFTSKLHCLNSRKTLSIRMLPHRMRPSYPYPSHFSVLSWYAREYINVLVAPPSLLTVMAIRPAHFCKCQDFVARISPCHKSWCMITSPYPRDCSLPFNPLKPMNPFFMVRRLEVNIILRQWKTI